MWVCLNPDDTVFQCVDGGNWTIPFVVMFSWQQPKTPLFIILWLQHNNMFGTVCVTATTFGTVCVTATTFGTVCVTATTFGTVCVTATTFGTVCVTATRSKHYLTGPCSCLTCDTWTWTTTRSLVCRKTSSWSVASWRNCTLPTTSWVRHSCFHNADWGGVHCPQQVWWGIPVFIMQIKEVYAANNKLGEAFLFS